MLTKITAAEYVRAMDAGRTSPSLVNCERDDGSIETIVVKFSDFCDQKEVNLAREIVAACLAGDLGLPVPEPFLVEIPQGWADVVPDAARRARVAASSSLAFGSKLITGGYTVWTPDTRIQEGMVDIAAAVFTFDAITQNPDRRATNPNCLVRGEGIRIIDHELAFAHRVILGWRPPWTVGGLNWLETNGSHIFRPDLRRAAVDFAPIQQRWTTISDARINEYGSAVPAEWTNIVLQDVNAALSLIHDARDNIGACLTEIQRVLS